MSWRLCPLEDDVEPLKAKAATFPQRLKRAWQTLDLDDGDDVPKITKRRTLDLEDGEDAPEVRGPGSKPVDRVNHKRKWCQLAISDDIASASSGESRHLRSWSKLDLEDARDDARPVRRRAWRQPDLHDHDVPAPHVVHRSREASLSASTLSFLSNLPTKKKLNKYDQKAMDPGQIRHVLQGDCKCKQKCIHQFTYKKIHNLRTVYHQMLETDRQFMLHTMYTGEVAPQTSGPTVQGPRSRRNWYIFGHKVCITAFTALLGISCRTLYRDIKLTLDGRRKLDDAGPLHPRHSPQLDICHHFFRALYSSAAEFLPVSQPRSGSGLEDSDDEQDELAGWSPDKPVVDLIGDSLGDLDPDHLRVRELPLFSMSDLYWQFQAWFEAHRGADPEVEVETDSDAGDDGAVHGPRSDPKKMPSRKTFSKCWYGSWSKVLQLKFPSDHSCCQTCFELREKTYRTWAPLPQKLQWARMWRDHLRDQYMDRVLYWNLRFASREFDSTVLVIIIDSMDRKKAVWPKYDFTRKPHEIEALKPRPRMTITGGIAHGWCTCIFVAQETLTHGSNAYVEVLCQILDKVADMCKVQCRRFPVHLVLQADNTVAQTKNQYASAFCSQMVGMQKFSTVTLNFLMVGHTHEDIDQLFALICQYIIRRYRWQTPDEFQRLLQETLAQKIAEKNEVLVVRGLRCIRDYSAWLQPQLVTLYGCWGNRDGFEAPHSFAFKRRCDLSAHELAQVQGRRVPGCADHADDVFCCVKAYMRDKRLQQPPLMVLPQSRRDRVHGRPNIVEPYNMTAGRAAQLEAIATVISKEQYGYIRAANALRALARSEAPALPAPGWLEEPPAAQPPVVDVGNIYFSHLPDVSWHMRACFHRI